MTFNVTITIPIKNLKNLEAAHQTAENMVEHLLETFNDNNSLSRKGVHITCTDKRIKQTFHL